MNRLAAAAEVDAEWGMSGCGEGRDDRSYTASVAE